MLPRGAASLLLLLVASAAAAQEAPELITDRPDQTESAVTVLPGWVQVEGGITHDPSDMLVPGVLARVGLAPRLELRLGAEAADLDVQQGSLGGKARLWDESGGRPEAALLVQGNVPVESGPAGGEVRLSLANTLTERLSVGYNVGASWGDLRAAPAVLYTLALGIGLAERAGAFVELFGEDAWPGVDGGLTYLLAPNLQLDVAGGHALRTGGSFVGVGLSYRLPR